MPTTTTKQKIGLVFFGVLLFFILLEGGLRIGGSALNIKKNFQNRKVISENSTYRILCLGESTTDKQWPHHLEHILNNKKGGIHFTVIDKGYSGANTAFIVSQLEPNLEKYTPHMVLVMMGINDASSTVKYEDNWNVKRTLFFQNFRVYKLAHVLWKHIYHVYKEITMKGVEDFSTHTMHESDDEVYALFQKALAMNPRQYELYVLCGEYLYLRKGNYDEAENILKKAITLAPHRKEAYIDLGWLYSDREEPEKAMIMFTKARHIDPTDNETNRRLGWYYYDRKQYNKAEELFRQAGGDVDLLYDIYEATIYNYRKLRDIVVKEGIPLGVIQYPIRKVDVLKNILMPYRNVFFVDNEKIFKDAVQREGYDAYFSDNFAYDFGHCTEKGNRLLAENIAQTIINEYFSK